MGIDFENLKADFEPTDIEFRAGATNDKQNPTKALALAYITSRAVMDRLDAVCGPENWRDEYKPGPDGGIVCGISIRVESEWITKWDGAENTEFEAVKGGLSHAFKRAAVKWGIGRYLYSIPAVWVSCQKRGKSVVINEDEARQKVFKNQPQKNPQAVDTQTGEVVERSNQKSNNNGKVASDPMTAFWLAVKAKGLSRQEGQRILANTDDPVKALDELEGITQEPADAKEATP